MAHEVTFIPGDGTGPELAEATRRVLEATGRRVRTGTSSRPAIDVYEEEGNPFPDAHARVDQAHEGRDQGPDDDAGRLGLSLDQRAAAQGARPLRLHPPVQGLRGRAHALPRDRHRRSCARTPRTSTPGIEFERGTPRGNATLRALLARARRLARPRGLRHLDQADLASSAPSASCARAFDYASDNGRAQGRPPRTRRTS